MKAILQVFNRVKLIYQIMIGLVIGISVALIIRLLVKLVTAGDYRCRRP